MGSRISGWRSRSGAGMRVRSRVGHWVVAWFRVAAATITRRRSVPTTHFCSVPPLRGKEVGK